MQTVLQHVCSIVVTPILVEETQQAPPRQDFSMEITHCIFWLCLQRSKDSDKEAKCTNKIRWGWEGLIVFACAMLHFGLRNARHINYKSSSTILCLCLLQEFSANTEGYHKKFLGHCECDKFLQEYQFCTTATQTKSPSFWSLTCVKRCKL